MKKLLTVLLIFAFVLTAVFAAGAESVSDSNSDSKSSEKVIPYDKVTDKRVIDFISMYAGGFSPDEYVKQVDTLDEIGFTYNSKNDVHSVYFEYSNFDEAILDFYPNELEMYYYCCEPVPSSKRAEALEAINKYNSYIDYYVMGTVFLDDEGYICLKHNVFDDGVTDYMQWSYWNFYAFESFAGNVVDWILSDLGLI